MCAPQPLPSDGEGDCDREGQLPNGQSAPFALLADRPADDVLRELAAAPPLCMRQLETTAPYDLTLSGDWPRLLLALATFLCRSIDGGTLTICLSGAGTLPVAWLACTAPPALVRGQSDLLRLADAFPDAPELTTAAVIAARSRISVTCRVEGSADMPRLAFIAAAQPDPAAFGLKQPLGRGAEARAAEEAEWCRLLRAALPAAE